MDHNPIVRLEAIVGLSPSPLERLFGVRGLFSGMTEAAHRLSMGSLHGASSANMFFAPLAFIVVGLVLIGHRPRIRNRRDEALILGSTVALTLLLNVLQPG